MKTQEEKTIHFGDQVLHMVPDPNHELLMSTADVANGYGVNADAIRHQKKRHSDELREGKHYFPCVTKRHAGKPPVRSIYWTKRGIVRLGFFIKSERARLFRDWIEDLVIDRIKKDRGQDWYTEAIESIRSAAHILGSQEKLAKTLSVSTCTVSCILNDQSHKYESATIVRLWKRCAEIVSIEANKDEIVNPIVALLHAKNTAEWQKLIYKLKGGNLSAEQTEFLDMMYSFFGDIGISLDAGSLKKQSSTKSRSAN